MRTQMLIAVALAALLLPVVPLGSATGGNQTFRIPINIDAVLAGLSSSCPGTYANPGTCWLLKTNLGYDGLSGASTSIPDHVNHAFACAITSSLTSPADGTPAGSSFWVGFDFNNDGLSDSKYGGRSSRPGLGQAVNEFAARVNNLDAVGVANYPLWYAGQVQWNGPTNSAFGNVDHQNLVIWLESGYDVEIQCTF